MLPLASHSTPNTSPTHQHVPHNPNTRTCPCVPSPLPRLEHQNASTRTRSGVRALLSTTRTRRTRPQCRVLRVRDGSPHPRHENATPVSRFRVWDNPAPFPPPSTTQTPHGSPRPSPAEHAKHAHKGMFFVFGASLLVPHPPNMQNTPWGGMFCVFGVSSFVLHPLSSLTRLPSRPAPPSCLSRAEHQIQAHGGPVFDVRRVMALPYPPKTKNTPPGRVFCVRCVPISSPSAEHKQHASGACLSCSARPQPSPTRRTQVIPPLRGVFCVRRVPSHSPSAEHKQHAPGGVSFVFGASPFIPTHRTRTTHPNGGMFFVFGMSHYSPTCRTRTTHPHGRVFCVRHVS